MSEPSNVADEETMEKPHASAAALFARRVRDRDVPGIQALILFGSTARDEAVGLASDVDFLAVVSDRRDKDRIADELRDIAYDVMLECGPVVEVHVLSSKEYKRRQNHPFLRRVRSEGKSYV